MDSRQNIFKSGTNCVDGIQGYSLKKQSLKKWIYENKLTQPYVARRMNLAPEVFKERLTARTLFNRAELRELIRLMGAMEAFKVIYFPILEDRLRVFNEVFIAPMKEELRIR